jgi:hypothetical protein
MSGLAATYAVAIFAMFFAAISALALFYTVDHLDAPETPSAAHDVRETVTV